MLGAASESATTVGPIIASFQLFAQTQRLYAPDVGRLI
jgi:hypothetical protein